jgi:hypothetical protein
MRLALVATTLLALSSTAVAAPCFSGLVFEDRNGNGLRDGREPGVAGVLVSDGGQVVRTDVHGRYTLSASDAAVVSIIKPAGWQPAKRADGLPDIWRHVDDSAALAADGASCRPFALRKAKGEPASLSALLFADPQTTNATEVDFYHRDVVAPLVGQHRAQLGLTLGDITNDDPALYPALVEATSQLGVPWLNIPGNHDMDMDATSDANSLASFQRALGPDTFAWEESQAVFIGLDDIIAQPGQRPAYIGGLREEQFAWLQQYLATLDARRLVVVGLHMPLFDPAFRAADRQRLFDLLARFPKRLVLSAHTHTQQHRRWGASDGWQGAGTLHEYNVGAACGAFWSGVSDAAGIPVTTMADGTPNGYGLLHVDGQGDYTVEYRAARTPADVQMHLHGPTVLRQGAYPAWGLYANVWMGEDDTVVEFRVDGGDWQPMKRINAPDPALLVENVADDLADALRSFDRSPEAKLSPHLWRGALPTKLGVGEHQVEVRAKLPAGEHRASTRYRLEAGSR